MATIFSNDFQNNIQPPTCLETRHLPDEPDFFSWIDSEPRRSAEVESWLNGRPELRPLVEDGGDGFTYLSAAGDLLYKVAQERLTMKPTANWPPPDPKPPGEKNRVSGVGHHRPAGWERFVERLCAMDCVTSVRYDAQALGARVTVLDRAHGVIGVCLGDRGNELPLRVETTTRGEEQTELVAAYLRNRK